MRSCIIFIIILSFAHSLHGQCVGTNCADIVWHNAVIYTVNGAQPTAEAFAIKEGALIYVGTDAGVEAFIKSDTRVEDMSGKFIMPGIHDVHMHPLEAGSPIGGT
ncbi:MAG: putative amidohydrolase YtcJ [Saprospiraceae bacterium]|jgi:predicted amidohydrolase YtcJ